MANSIVAPEKARAEVHEVASAMAATDERLRLIKDLALAIERFQLVLYYQPLVDMATGRVAGVEALVRWLHPDLGLVPPAYFIPLAEEADLVQDIGEWALATACRQGRIWHEKGHHYLQVAVNLSSLQLQQGDFPDRVGAILKETGFDPACLDFEITETAIMQDPEQAAAILRRIKADRIKVSLDDFGTGYSSLSYLKQFPIDRIKIDRTFVRGCHRNRNDAGIVDAVVRLALNLDMEVLAEGVEQEVQLLFLQGLKCDLVQGYLFSRPVPAGRLEKLLYRTWRWPSLSANPL